MKKFLSQWNPLRRLSRQASPLSPVHPQELSVWLASGDTLLVDVREKEEFARDHVEGALSAPLSAFPGQLSLPQAVRRVVFHCQTGTRTRLAAARLAASTALPSFVLSGGLNDWRRMVEPK
ncbi:MAG: rhodanese-like domain-containing protein [Rhodospirillales bacterium]|nr:rhodanese-like domain-containing protein [Rhodospirillales bacterium]